MILFNSNSENLFTEMIEVIVESEFKITNVPWNNNLSDPNSQTFMEMKTQLETELENVFCNKSMVTGKESESCSIKVLGFTEGSINVLFQINDVVEISVNSLPNDAQILSNMQQKISEGIGNYVISENSTSISKKILNFGKDIGSS